MTHTFLYRNLEIWGTVISIQSSDANSEGFDGACDKAEQYYISIDQQFSTYKELSEVSRLRRGELKIDDASPEMKLVWNKSLELRELTQRKSIFAQSLR
ncbi:MAG: hypothetical protein ACKOEB_02350 [Actinomycetota bacterium]